MRKPKFRTPLRSSQIIDDLNSKFFSKDIQDPEIISESYPKKQTEYNSIIS